VINITHPEAFNIQARVKEKNLTAFTFKETEYFELKIRLSGNVNIYFGKCSLMKHHLN